MMKKRTWTLLTVWAILALLLTACGSAAANSADNTGMADAAAVAAYDEAAEMDDGEWAAAQEAAAETEAAEAPDDQTESGAGLLQGENGGELADKIIYTAYAEIETTEFDQSVETVYGLLDRYGAFLENSSVTGNNLQDIANGWAYGRTAQFTIRVPKEHYSDVTAALSTVGNVTYQTSDASNITAQYTDVQAQLQSYETQEQRLLEIMAQADTVEDMITLESRLAEVRAEKDRLNAQLENWDRQVDYSTVALSLTEVQELTLEPPAEEPTYLQQLGDTFVGSVQWVGRAAKTLLKLLVAVIPVLLPISVVILVVVLLCKGASRRKVKKLEKRQNEASGEEDQH